MLRLFARRGEPEKFYVLGKRTLWRILRIRPI
jgi:hypothetical protein